MARDEKARERGQPRLDRRSYLRLGGAAAEAVALGNEVRTAGAAEYSRTVDVVQAGGRGLIKNVSMADGSQSPSKREGIRFGRNGRGTLVFDGLHVETFANNSVRAFTDLQRPGPIRGAVAP